ncbi:MAG: CehA/McbA family metallohydrolase [Rhodothermales bacterium]
MFDALLIDRSDFSLSEPVLVTDQTAHEPDICVDPDGRPWVIWSERNSAGDRICLRCMHEHSSPFVLSSSFGVECQPAITVDSNGDLLAVWVAKRDHAWHIISRTVRGDSAGVECILASSPEGVFKPRVLFQDGVGWVVYEEVSKQQSRIQFMRLEKEGWSAPETIDCGPGNCFRPSIAPGSERTPSVSFDKYDEGSFEILFYELDQSVSPTSLTNSFYRNVQSVLKLDGQAGQWITWATNEGNQAEDAWWLTKYVTLRRLEGDRLLEPVEPIPERDLQNEDAFQGWEFPELTVDRYGRVWLLGQASHRLYAQYLDAGGWSERFTISQERWGSWKPRVRAAGSNPIFIASMGLQGAQIQQLRVRPPSEPMESNWHARLLEPIPPLAARRDPSSRVSSPVGGRPQISSGLNVYFGDLHAHSAYGDAVGDVDELYFRYRDAYGYDFAALTEHDYLDGMQLSRSELEMMWAVADRMTVDDHFVAFYGYEWTSPALADHAGQAGKVGEGHRHVLYPDKSGPLISYGDPSSNTGKKLLARLAGRRALVIPHHTAWSGTDLDAYDPALSRLIEICSTHGRFEYPGNRPIGYRRDHVHAGKYVVDALRRGQRLGFVGGSDSHGLLWHATEMEGRAAHIPAGTRVGWKEDAYRTGMTAVLAPELTRPALFDALYDRRCYATSGVPIFLDFRIDEALMGSEISVTSPPRLTLSVRGTADLQAVELVRQGFVFDQRMFAERDRQSTADMEWMDDLLIPGETQYYYVRVIQRDGNMAWSSPIWVTYV